MNADDRVANKLARLNSVVQRVRKNSAEVDVFNPVDGYYSVEIKLSLPNCRSGALLGEYGVGKVVACRKCIFRRVESAVKLVYVFFRLAVLPVGYQRPDGGEIVLEIVAEHTHIAVLLNHIIVVVELELKLLFRRALFL